MNTTGRPAWLRVIAAGEPDGPEPWQPSPRERTIRRGRRRREARERQRALAGWTLGLAVWTLLLALCSLWVVVVADRLLETRTPSPLGVSAAKE